MSNDEQVASSSRDEEEAAKDKVELSDEIVETEHSVVIDGQEISYTATTGRLVLKDEEGGPRASVFFIAYTRLGVADITSRPLTISFNGGPGSSSVWLHLGMIGPRRVLSGDVDSMRPPPYRLAENPFSLLDVTDLVFVDPVSTGYSRPAPGKEAGDFHGFDRDIESVGEFIRLFVTRYRRWASPKFLIGESYGTTRAAGLTAHLQDKCGMYLNGLMLVSSVLDFQTIRFTAGNDLPYIMYLPSYAATAWYHGRLAADLQEDLGKTVEAARTFAMGEYTLALMQGAALSAAERERIVGQLARFTGLTPEYIERADLRVDIMRFAKELLRGDGRTVGRMDSRFKGLDRDAVGEHFEHDPSISLIMGAYAATLNDYVRRELGFESDLPYQVLARLYENWEFSRNQFLNVAETLRIALTKNPFLKIFVANGYYDLATPFLATEYTFSHLGVDAGLQSNISMGYYEAGHMMYVHEASLAKSKEDLRTFIHSALQGVVAGE
jgi:carboxypeptidase C (cathepsin A)